ncbi:MAG: hypothetical protein AEth_01909 [Candidatus Argoarchaeum ethanivorans]|uniref:Uncharacterized protein n=1 Tax=Candidatus Argoarchaeum ethanivorans TaxID=2608793 RepID=A0A8B3S008_9EURY|nr:MAG: hypothetical protein AEth_01909 [Candidatus Argoarchaeum ethanivorans]
MRNLDYRGDPGHIKADKPRDEAKTRRSKRWHMGKKEQQKNPILDTNFTLKWTIIQSMALSGLSRQRPHPSMIHTGGSPQKRK